ncbi:MAG: TIGR02757 family protein [Aequorivita sp.]|nr:TIGR02757 family protein [Aequorivita sp.]MAO48166.1 TIGR02757 family protein [Aequorivita sp.]MBF30432.1 TIGR02757 family protein [Aequorivita sp.]HAV54411.1 TIGR02757 family protein [Aequorivita sp.]HBL79002.1 TIGR02757 family protein [Aequorivita sp.]|tara:strand:- start:90942 stop:91706 length:765 start_codon:yes stop_codon:yes gene_type:complete
MKKSELKSFLDEKVDIYNNPNFIETDPIQIPHLFTLKEDIEIAGFLVATIAWGNRKSIINNGHRIMEMMGNSPYDFVMNFSEDRAASLSNFVHRTFNNDDLIYFLKSLQNIYKNHVGLENVFSKNAEIHSLQPAIHHFKKTFFELPHPSRTQKHISDPFKNSAAKRINMFLRWMVRNDNAGVDFGIWKSISPAILSCPLDVHCGNVARKLKLLKRKQNDGKALAELDIALRKLDPNDPVKYDFALFGLGVFERF